MIRRIVASIVSFLAKDLSNPKVFFSLKSSAPQERGIIPQNFSSLGSTVSEELAHKQTNTLTDILLLYKINVLGETDILLILIFLIKPSDNIDQAS